MAIGIEQRVYQTKLLKSLGEAMIVISVTQTIPEDRVLDCFHYLSLGAIDYPLEEDAEEQTEAVFPEESELRKRLSENYWCNYWWNFDWKHQPISSLFSQILVNWWRASAINDYSRPLIEPEDLENLGKLFKIKANNRIVSVSPSLVRTKDKRRISLRPISAGLLLWLESSECLDEDESKSF